MHSTEKLAEREQDARVLELIRLEPTTSAVARPLRGGLPVWQQKRLIEFIQKHLGQEISLTDLAELVGLSLCHFARAFKQSFGVPPHRYHMACRMDHARNLLQRPALSVTQIGIQVGFRETSSFTRAFRKFTGLTPTEYRRHRGDLPPRRARDARQAPTT
jgi:AraC family transcriptional regulator